MQISLRFRHSLHHCVTVVRICQCVGGLEPCGSQSFPTLKDVRRAICQVRCPERNKEIIDDLPLFVSPCVLSTPVNLMQECDNKVVQKSQQLIYN